MAKPTPQQAAFTDYTPLCKAMGMHVTDIGVGTATFTMPYTPELIGDPETGVIHGGAISTLLDSVSGLAVIAHPEQNGGTATIDLRIDYMRPATVGEDLIAHADVYHITRNVAITRATAWGADKNKPFAQATGAFTFSRKVASND